MILGLSLSAFTSVHVALSLIGIVSGIVVFAGMLAGNWLNAWNIVFLVTTVATSATGFLFPTSGLLPSQVVGIISLVALAVAIAALYGYHLAGAWRRIYVATAAFALYLNVFVLVVQAFRKIPALQSLAPTQSEPPFIVAQVVVMVIFVVVGYLAAKRFYPARAALA
jgi:hypothetical protein